MGVHNFRDTDDAFWRAVVRTFLDRERHNRTRGTLRVPYNVTQRHAGDIAAS